MVIEAVDTTAATLVENVKAAIAEDTIDRPDALFVIDACDDVARLTTLGGVGEELNAPVVVGVTPALFGLSDPAAVSTKIEDERGGLPEAWETLRADEVSRWLCAVTNRVVMAADGTGSARRHAFGNPVFRARRRCWRRRTAVTGAFGADLRAAGCAQGARNGGTAERA